MRVRLCWEFDANCNDIHDLTMKRDIAELAAIHELSDVITNIGAEVVDEMEFEVLDFKDNPDFDENGDLIA